MDTEEYKNSILKIDKDAIDKKRELAKRFALSNSKVKIGNMVTDHIGTILVEKIGVYVGFSKIPECVYYGKMYTKTGELFKNGESRQAYQGNLKK